MDKETKVRLILAIVISFIIMFIFTSITEKNYRVEKTISKETQINQEDKKETFEQEKKKEKKEIPQNTLDNKKKQEILPEKIVRKETENYILEFSTKGAILKKIVLKKYFHEGGKQIDVTPLEEENLKPLLTRIGASYDNFDFTLLEENENELTFVQENSEWIFKKKYVLSKNNYDFQLEISITNKKKMDWQEQFILTWAKGLGPRVEKPEDRTTYDNEIHASVYDKKKEEEIKIIGDSWIGKNKEIEWAGIDNRYFFVALIPDKPEVSEVSLANYDKNDIIYDEVIHLTHNFTIKPGETWNKNYTIYIGPKDERLLKSYQRKLEAITERGFAPITLIGKGIKWLIFWINGLVSNFGITIIIISLIFKVLLHPLTKKSMDSAKKMQALQPQIQALKEKYPDSKEFNQKVWELYQSQKINPAGGCLPILLQMPFFFALYSVLPYIVELKNTDFLWIHDLSSPDTVAYIATFKDVWLLPYKINILPILLAIFSIVQTKVQQGGAVTTPQGKIMEYLMPILFLFIFWNMPSGLVLYWFMQTLFTIIHQLIVNKIPSSKKQNNKTKTPLKKRM